jgi:hypothetical protein
LHITGSTGRIFLPQLEQESQPLLKLKKHKKVVRQGFLPVFIPRKNILSINKDEWIKLHVGLEFF